MVLVHNMLKKVGEEPRLLSKEELKEEMWKLGETCIIVKPMPIIENVDELKESDEVIIIPTQIKINEEELLI